MASSQVSGPVVQLRVVLRGVSPLVWRRLLVPEAWSLGELAGVQFAIEGTTLLEVFCAPSPCHASTDYFKKDHTSPC